MSARELSHDASVILLPHYRRRGDDVLFLIEPEPVLRLAPEERALFDAFVTETPVRQLSVDVRSFASRLCELGIAVACPPVAEATGPRLLVIEPHMDDAVLSTGGQLLLRRGLAPSTVLTVVRWSDFWKYVAVGAAAPEKSTLSELRLRETQLAARFVGFDHEALDELDFPLGLRTERGVAPDAPFAELREAFKRFAPSHEATCALAVHLFARVKVLQPDELFIPLGVGENPDHVRVARACLQMLHDEPAFFAARRVSFYEDLAPFPLFAGHSERIVAVHRRSGVLREVVEEVTPVFPALLRAVGLYASQIDMADSSRPMSNVGRMLTESATPEPGSPRRVERRYEIVKTPRLPDHSDVALRPLGLVAALVALAPWVRLRDQSGRIVLFNTGAFGAWSRGIAVLTRVFVRSSIEVFATQAHVWETSPTERVSVRTFEVLELDALLADQGSETLVLVLGGVLPTGRASRRCVRVETFGDAMMALEELAR